MKAFPDPNKFESVPRFNEWIDTKFAKDNGGDLEILGEKLRPSEVLHKFSFDTYQAKFAEYKRHREEAIISTVTESFPIVIAHPFYRCIYGFENEIQRLQFLRDTWEGLINFVHALVVSESRAEKLPLGAPVKCANVLSDSLATRIGTIENVLSVANSSGIPLESTKIVNLEVVTTIKELNHTRNAFSHSGAVSEHRATALINECIEDVFDVLDGFSLLRDVKLLRYDRLDGLQMRHERFDGHAKTRRYGGIQLNPTRLSTFAPLLTKEETLLAIKGKIFSACPFLVFVPHSSGHSVQVAFYKKARGDAPNRKLIFEIVGEANEIEQDRSQFQPVINEIRAQFGEHPE